MAYTQVKTPIVYYGGKTSIVNHLLDMVPVHEVYTETFFGGGTLFWAKDPVKNETINDRLDIVINFYVAVPLQAIEKVGRYHVDFAQYSP
jgi:DNA adenine methylase